MQKTAQLKVLPVGVLRPAAYNPRKKLKPGDKEYEKIKNSITEFGFADPLVVNSDMTIVGGHQRLAVAMELGYTEVPCAVVDVDKVREKALNIALNKITGAWDDSLLADLLKDLEDSEFDLGKTGFEPPEISEIFNNVHAYVIQNGSVIRTAVIFFYLSNEGISILENASVLGLPVPQKLKDVLEQLKDGKEGE